LAVADADAAWYHLAITTDIYTTAAWHRTYLIATEAAIFASTDRSGYDVSERLSTSIAICKGVTSSTDETSLENHPYSFSCPSLHGG